MGGSKALVIDIETTGLSPWRGDKTVGVAFWPVWLDDAPRYAEPGNLDLGGLVYQADFLVLHNSSFDLGFLMHEGYLRRWPGVPVYDTMVGQWLLDENSELGLKKIGAKLWGTDQREEERRVKELMRARCSVCGGHESRTMKGVKHCKAGCHLGYTEGQLPGTEVPISSWQTKRQLGELSFEEIKPYAVKDVELTWDLYRYQQKVKGPHFDQAMAREMEIVRICAAMTGRGVVMGEGELEQAEAQAMLAAAELGSAIPCNPNSPPQVKKWLLESGVKIGDSTDVDSLLPLQKHDEVRTLLAYRKVAKELGYYKQYRGLADEYSYLHPRFRPHGTVSGRFSCSEPNLQQMPRGGRVKSCILPEPGHVFLTADLSQAELRVAAEYSQCRVLLDMFERGEDVYLNFAEKAGVDRQTGKIVVLSALYGTGARKLRKTLLRGGVDVPEREARRLLDEYFKLFPELKWLQEAAERKAKNKGEIQILVPGRYRHFPKGQHYPANPKDAMNSLVQGTVAELMKSLMLTIEPFCEKLGVVMSLQVHDSLTFQVPKGKEAEWTSLLTEQWEKLNPLRVKIPMEVKQGL